MQRKGDNFMLKHPFPLIIKLHA